MMASSGDISTTEPLWRKTPLISSPHISDKPGLTALLKLENLQPGQSFKSRGLSHFVQDTLRIHGPSVHLVIASGGNAAVAVACAAHTLGLRCTVFLPVGASNAIVHFLKSQGASVQERGSYYLQALRAAEEAVRTFNNAVMVPAYDSQLVWEGHASMVTEIREQLPQGCERPDAIVCSVGGGGLLGGVIRGCQMSGWDDVPIIAVETHGADCFHHSLRLNQDKAYEDRLKTAKSASHGNAQGGEGIFTPLSSLTPGKDAQNGVLVATLSPLTSKAASLGASAPSAGVVRMATQRAGPVTCLSVPDEMAMSAAVAFADDHKLLVELACSATLTLAYNRALLNAVFDAATGGPATTSKTLKNVVFVVCGGLRISVAEMSEYAQVASAHDGKAWDVLLNGERLQIPMTSA